MAKPKRKQLISSSQAVPSDTQHSKPCSDCPWARTSLVGWTGEMSPQEWIEAAHGEALVDCHALIGPQCAGVAIYRANVCKTPRDPRILRLSSDCDSVFASPKEFLNHHKK